MIKFYCYLLLLVSVVANAQVIDIPDANLKAKLVAASPSNQIASSNTGAYIKIDTNNDGQIQLTEAALVKGLKLNQSNIASLEGLQHFPNLAELSAYLNTITSFTGSASMKIVNLDSNLIASVDLSSCSQLESMDLHSNRLASINLTGCVSLKELRVYSNRLTSLNLSSCPLLVKLDYYENLIAVQPDTRSSVLPHLEELDCSKNPFSFNSALVSNTIKTLKCASLNLTSLDLTTFTQLKALECYLNNLTTLELHSSELVSLVCSDNVLTSINFGPTEKLQFLDARINNLQRLDFGNQISGIGNYGYYLSGNPQLTSINFKNGVNSFNDVVFSVAGNNALRYICADDSEVTALRTKLIAAGIINCQINTDCNFFPITPFVVTGTNKFDNGTGCDVSDVVVPNLQLNFTNNTSSETLYGNASGDYFKFLPYGLTTITPVLENPQYFNVSPSTVSVNIDYSNSPLTRNFCVTANGQLNDLEILLVPLTVARPGFTASYKVVYRNKGTRNMSGNYQLNYNAAQMTFENSNGATASQSPGFVQWNYINLKPFESRETIVNFLMNLPTGANALELGANLQFRVSIDPLVSDETPADNTFVINQIVVASLDPNDKKCVEGTTVSTSVVGKYVHYIIRFENTGTFAAEKVVVKDMIDLTKFDINSLIPISGSHAFVTKVSNNNKVEFIFENINLPFDDANNDGYLTFKIKTKSNLVVGNSFSNQANIYFDYNAPIITNNETTTIAALAINDFNAGDYLMLYPNPASEWLHIESKKDIKISSFSIYDISGRLIQLISNPEINPGIDVSSLKTGNYFIKINSDKGTTNAKFAKK